MRCDFDTLISKISAEKLNKKVEVDFSILGNLPDCKRINTSNYLKMIDAQGAEAENTATYNKYQKPLEKIECASPNECLNTGTLYINDATKYAVYRLPYDATKFADGIITLYAIGIQTGNVTVKISSTSAFTDADTYTVSVASADAEQFVPVVVDLSSTPSSVEGEGWTPSANGAYIAVSTGNATAGISSIAVYDSIEDFENNDVVKIGCLTALDDDVEIDAAEATCAYPSAQHDTSSLSFERTITGNTITENFGKLNPLEGKGDATVGYKIKSQTFTATAGTGAEANYAKVTLLDLYQQECGFVAAQADCYLLKRYDIPALVAIDEEHFIVRPNADGSTDIFFNKNLAGKEIIISYPKQVNITEYVGSEDFIDTVRTRMFVPHKYTNGKMGAKVYNNVLVTSYSISRSEDETEISITVSIQKDASGHYYHRYEYDGTYFAGDAVVGA